MASVPTPVPVRGYSFTDFATVQPSTPLPGQKVDQELDRVNNFTAQLIPWLRTSIDDDGSIKPGAFVVSSAGVIWRGDYAPGANYVVNDIVSNQQSAWICVSNTPASGVAPPPLPATSNSKWALLAQKGNDGSAPGTSASGITVTPAGNVSATNVQGALQELDSEKAPLAHTHAIADVTGLTTVLAAVGKFTKFPAGPQKTSSYTLVPATDAGNFVVFNSATPVTASLPALASANEAVFFVKNAGNGVVTIDPNGTELIGSAAIRDLIFGETIVLIPTASGWEFFFTTQPTAFVRSLANDTDGPTFLSSIGAPSAVAPVLTGVVSVEDIIDFNGATQYAVLDFAPGDKLYYDRTNNLYLFHIGDVEKARINATGFVGDGSQLTNLPTPPYGGVGWAGIMYLASGSVSAGGTAAGGNLRFGTTVNMGPFPSGTWTNRGTATVTAGNFGFFERTA